MKAETKRFSARANVQVLQVEHEHATIWIAYDDSPEVAYFYGGTRLVAASTRDAESIAIVDRLTCYESGMKNRLINCALADGVLDDLGAELPPGLVGSCVGGARCLIRPRTDSMSEWRVDAARSEREDAAMAILACIGESLNALEGRVKLTPDFGKNAGLADLLLRFTPNVLGISCRHGGCGGKSSYSTTGILAAVELTRPYLRSEARTTCIGAAGALGTDVLRHFIEQGQRPGACDLVYDVPVGERVPEGCVHLRSRDGCFTGECLERGGLIVATTVGDELERSAWHLLPTGTVLLLAHNLALPPEEAGIRLAKQLARMAVLAIPGQVLTLGGALTSRFEWYWRQAHPREELDKALCHEVVRRAVGHLTRRALEKSTRENVTPYEAVLDLAGMRN